MNSVELMEEIVTFLRGTIPTPHANNKWIYPDYPRTDATFPRISVTQVSLSWAKLGIGESLGEDKTGSLCSIEYDIDVWVKVDDRATINGVTFTGTKLRDKYSDLIIDSLNKAKQTFKDSKGLLDIEISNATTIPLDEDTMLHRKTITVRFSFIWED